MAFLESIARERTQPCLAAPGKLIVVGRPARDLADVLPFLAALPNAVVYNPQPLSLTLRRNPGLITLQPDRVSITQVDDSEEGMQLLASLAEAINATWEHRAELVKVTATRRAPRPLDIWTLLPQTNCGRCGEATCMAFACNLLLQKRDLEECPTLQTDAAFADNRATLEAML